MTREEAGVIIGNIPIDGKDDCYSIAEYQEAKTMAIEALQAQKTGKWIKKAEGNGVIAYECSECKRAVWNDADHDVLRDYPYCHCGARMECEEE